LKVILDTHAFLWWIADSDRLSRRAREILGESGNTLFLSAASAWEIVLKQQIGKLKLPQPAGKYIPSQLAMNRIDTLPISLSHTLRLADLPLHHRDPFDRILIAQSIVERMPIVTADPLFAHYSAKTLW
jgi:PIN domain nuclease of toxin-antitoxin system